MSRITFAEKTNAITNTTPAKQKVGADDMNEIKASVNAIYDALGWASYSESGILAINDTFIPYVINRTNVNEEYLPKIMADADPPETLWDTGDNSTITPKSVGDSYTVRANFTVDQVASGSPNVLTLALYIGATNPNDDPSNIIYEQEVDISGLMLPYKLAFNFSIVTLDAFLANGGKVYLKVDAGIVTLATREIFIRRDFGAELHS